MPFYLVTHTSLVEADDEQAAAQKAVDQIRAGGAVKVTVKSDETTVYHIEVAPKPEKQPEAPTKPHGSDDTLETAAFEPAPQNNHEDASRLGRIVGRTLAFLHLRR